MGIETAAALAATAASGAAAAAPVAAGAAGAAGALTAAEAAAAAATIAEGAAATTAATGAVTGSLEAANLVGALGGDAMGAFLSANQGFGTMTALESIQGMGAALQESPLIAGLTSMGETPQEDTTVIKTAAPAAGDVQRPNQNPGLTQSTQPNQRDATNGAASLDALGFENGGRVPQNRLQEMAPNNIFAQTRERREQEAGVGSSPSITINVGSQQQPQQQAQAPATDENTILSLIRKAVGYQDGGVVRTGSSDVKAGGTIRGPESKTGHDNQIIKVAGGEGILPKDVMDVPGVADLVQGLIQTYHKPL